MLPQRLNPGVLLAVAAACSTIAVAQQQQPTSGGLYAVTHVVIKADHRASYLDYLKKVSDGYKKAGVQSFHVYVGLAGNPLEYVLVRSVKNYAELDEPNALAKAYTETQLAQVNTIRDQCTESVRISYERSVASVGGGEPKAFRGVFRFRVKPGMNEAYMNAMKNEFVPAASKVDGTRWRLRRIERGGSPSDFIQTFDVDKMAKYDEPSTTTKAFGAEGAAKWNTKLTELGTPIESLLYRHLPGFGYTLPAR